MVGKEGLEYGAWAQKKSGVHGPKVSGLGLELATPILATML